ncbi:MAG: hypothetical protein ACHQX3_06245, partial [Nitrospirales bacterium]
MTTVPSVPTEMVFQLVEERVGVLDLNCENGYVVLEYDLGVPTVREVMYSRPFSDGVLDQSEFIGSRVVNLQLAFDERVAPLPRLREALFAYFHPRLRPYLRFTELRDQRWQRIFLRGGTGGIVVSQPIANHASISWVGYNGVIESDELHTAVTRPLSTSPAGTIAPAIVV